MKLTKNFSLKELVNPRFLVIYGDQCADFLHYRLAYTLQKIRDKFGRITVNGKMGGQVFTNSGLRLPHSRIGAKNSRHKQGVAADCKFYDTTPIKVQKYLLEHEDDFPYIVRMEDAKVTKTWLHVEVGKRQLGQAIKVFKP